MRASRGCVLAVLALSVACSARAEQAYGVEWIERFGTMLDGTDTSGLAVDANNNVLITGHTHGSLGGPNQGSTDAFVAKYDAAGNNLWVRQWGTSSNDLSRGIATDTAGNVLIVGSTAQIGGDAFLTKYDTDGNLAWAKLFGTGVSHGASDVTTDVLGNIMVIGSTRGLFADQRPGERDAYLAKYDPDGQLVWTRQLGTEWHDYATAGVCDSAGNILITGLTEVALGGPRQGNDDIFLAKYAANGDLLWTRQFGTADSEHGADLTIDVNGNILITGETWGTLDGPVHEYDSDDAFVMKCDSDGNLIWVRQFGEEGVDMGHAVSTDAAGNVFIAGRMEILLEHSAVDAFAAKYDSDGNLGWTYRVATAQADWSSGIGADSDGNVFVTGHRAPFADPNDTEDRQVFLVKLAVPEPTSTWALLMLATLAYRGRRH